MPGFGKYTMISKMIKKMKTFFFAIEFKGNLDEGK